MGYFKDCLSKPAIVYVATLIGTGRSYVGATTTPLKARMAGHKSAAKCGSDWHFHRAIRKYGWDAFQWEVLCACETFEDALRAETIYIAAGWSHYNETEGGEGAKGRPMTDEHRARISAAKQGVVIPPEQIALMRKGLSDWMKVNGHPKQGKPVRQETRSRISDSNMGKPGPNKGRKFGEDFQEKARARQLGKQPSEETRRKMSESHKLRWALKRGEITE